ncbi:cytochrome P450 family protein [Rhizoctonia solani]|uniref:Cytochrome P450 family protein n=1 Tax=Rhizoctonia solani TaxID=456999 RepID=A0A8H8P7E1_9AGAM|nr:cytochrome P450 family protein [Rhizoctonia solani]QRW26103.1 cytochrome P450 family protein [Rhizoctonia solani]
MARKIWCNSQRPLPPGPPSYPLIGQLLSLPRVAGASEFAEPSVKLKSDIISFRIFGTTIIVLNSTEVAHDLLEKRQNLYSNRYRPPMVVSPKLMDTQGFTAFLDSNNLWKKHRRAFSTRLNVQSATEFRPLQEKQCGLLLQRLLDFCRSTQSSNELLREFYRTASSIFLDSIYGYELKSADDPFFVDVVVLNEHLAKAAMPSPYLPEWFPGAYWKRLAREWRDHKNRTVNDIFYWAKQRIVNGGDDRSIIALTLKDAREAGWSEDEADDFAKNLGTMMSGSETSTMTLVWFVLAMVLHPEVQAKVQQEIDTAVGSNRLPTFSDRPNLPYLERVLLEVLRWRPGIPLGAPHTSNEEDEYRGYRIPKGAIVIGNIWATTREEKMYHNPEEFNPDRFLDPKVPHPLVFGWGSRICPGKHFFREMFFIEAAQILAVFKLQKLKDEKGQVVEPETRVTADSGVPYVLTVVVDEGTSAKYLMFSRPIEFKIQITPRSSQHVELIHTAA